MPSTVIRYYHYEPSSKTLRVGFVSGAVYDYQDVPEAVYDAMRNAFSKGTFLNRKVKDKYSFVKIK